jgi:hypothetical protein
MPFLNQQANHNTTTAFYPNPLTQQQPLSPVLICLLLWQQLRQQKRRFGGVITAELLW